MSTKFFNVYETFSTFRYQISVMKIFFKSEWQKLELMTRLVEHVTRKHVFMFFSVSLREKN